MTNEQDIKLRVTAEDEASKVINNVEKSAGGLGDTLGKVGTIAGGFLAANVVAGGVQALTGFVGDSVAAIRDSIQVNAQLDAVLKSTGSTSWTTAEAIKEHAAALEKNSLFEDEAILKGQNLLLTFTNVQNRVGEGNDIFDQATDIMADMAQAMGTDVSGGAIQLGKALNDPIAGISALSRVGVTFDDVQKKQIETMVKAGNVAGAQKIILNELNKEFGGSAKAASDAAGKQEVMKDKMNDLQETIGAKVLPIQEKWLQLQIIGVDFLTNKVIPVLESLYERYWPAVSEAINKATGIIEDNWTTINAVFQFAEDFIRTKIQGMITFIESLYNVISGVVELVEDLVHGRWSEIWGDLEYIAKNVVSGLIGWLEWQFGNLPIIIYNAIRNLPNIMGDVARDAANAFINNISIAGISVGDVAGFIGNIPGFASGGIAQGGWITAGENGPELLNVPSGTRIYNNQETSQMLGGQQSVVNIYAAGSILTEKDIVQIIRDEIQRGGLRGLAA